MEKFPIHFCLVYFSSIGNIKYPRSNSDTIKVNQFLKYSKPSSSSLLFPVVHEGCRPGGHPPVSLISPSASTDSTIHNVQLAIKDTN
jgi:hypothetical protein